MSKQKINNILFKIEFEGNGIINYDGPLSPKMKNFYYEKLPHLYHKEDNVTYAKKNYYTENGETFYKIKVSSDCIRNILFDDDSHKQTPMKSYDNALLLSTISSPVNILKGYFEPFKNGVALKKSTVFTIIDAEQTNGAISVVEFYSKSGKKKFTINENGDENPDDKRKSTSLFNKETVGEITYRSHGFVDK